MEYNNKYYNAMYNKGGYEGVYDLPYRRSYYYPLYREVLKIVRKTNRFPILEVGCGTGGFAHMLFDSSIYQYEGFDFSEIAVAKAIKRTTAPDRFKTGNALDPSIYSKQYPVIICTEVLEHIEDDLEVINLWPSGCICICSVPNFDSDSHVRYFNKKNQVIQRYKGLIDISLLKRIKKPILTDNTFINRLRHIRWNWNDPKKILQITGFGNFEKLGGWFIFAGTRKMKKK